ncbi:MAG: J domain-containing protein [Thermoanaerobaculia bacterium]|nr:J domain-containing protein [Thermoanaerobaculia bacterium]
MSRWGKWLAEGVRWGASNAPLVARATRRAAQVATDTRDAFRRGLRGEPEPPPSVHQRVTPDQVAAWYANLEIEPGADFETVHRAWKRLQRRYHPDLHADDPDRGERATTLIQELNAAYAGLKTYLKG